MSSLLNGKKVMILCTTDNMITQFLLPHMRDLQDMGATVECVCSRTGKWFDEIEEQGFVCHEIGFKRSPINIANLKAYRKLVKLQKKENYDIIYCQQPVGGLMGRLIGKKFKKTVFYTAHGFFFFKGCPLKNRLLYKTAEKWLARYTDVLVTMNEEDFESAKKMKAKRVYKISGIGVQLDKFQDLEFNKAEFKNSLGVKEDEKVIVSISEMIKRKNYDTMIKVISNLRYEKIKYLICGTGVLENQLKETVHKLGLDDKVIFLGYRNDVAKILKIADIFLHCSHMEGLTMSIMEAMNSGLPVVTSDVRGNRDLIDDGKGGFVCPPTNVKLITEKVKQLLDDSVMCSVFGVYNQFNVKKYSYENVKRELEKIYNDNF